MLLLLNPMMKIRHYAVPYSLDENGEVVIGEPKEVDNTWVEKMAEFYDEMLKDVRGDKLTDIEIPEGVDLDKSIVEKLKDAGDETKQFLKNVLGFEEKDSRSRNGSSRRSWWRRHQQNN